MPRSPYSLNIIRRPLNILFLLPTKFILILFTLFLFNFIGIEAFNVDTKNAQIHRRPNTGFGYTVDFAYRDSRTRKLTLLVGAPFAQTSQRRLQNTGAVYGCEIDTNLCVEIFFDQKGNELRLNGTSLLPIEEKSHQMFGATIVASKNGDNVLACAPHYKYFFAKFDVVEPVGSCYYSRDYFSKIQEFAPCRQEPARHGHHRLGYGMCGFSAAVPDFGSERLFISAPGAWYWQVEKGTVFSQNIHNITDRPNTADGPAHTDNQELGYSTATGDFDGDKLDDIVVGIPRGNEFIGMVSIYTRHLKPIANLTEKDGQRGQYFGASVAVLDLNNDGLSDVVVGSPLYINWANVDGKTQERKPQYDIGKISVYIQTGVGTFREPVIILGHEQWSRFGYSLAAAGDLNGDGFQDLLVGAPYDGEDGRGIVYIFHGSSEGIREKYTQKILARDVHRDMRTFGFSLRGGRDVDGNGYPDIAIGAFKSNQAAVLRSRPVIQVVGSVRTTRKTINLDEKHDRLRLCLKYTGKLAGADHQQIALKTEVHLDALKKGLSSRAFFSRAELEKRRDPNIRVHPASSSRDQPDRIEHTLSLTKGREQCESYEIYVPDTIRDKISPILISVNYSYVESGTPGRLEPAVDTTLVEGLDTELIIEKDCGEDNICVPDLHITARPANDKFTIGALDQTLILNVSVENKGEDSYLTQYTVSIPPGFEYGGIENYETKYSVSCSPAEYQKQQSLKNNQQSYEFICDIGNPLPAGATANFGFKLRGHDVDMSKEFVELKMGVNSTNEEAEGAEGDNQMVLRIPIEINAQLALTGRSTPPQVDYSVRNRTLGVDATFDFDIGPLVSHLFQVTNRGPSAISGASFDIFWPSYSEGGHYLLYLIDQPFVSDTTKAKCRLNQPQNINPANLAISNVHMATASPISAHGIEEEEEEVHVEPEEEIEEIETPQQQQGRGWSVEPFKEGEKGENEEEYIDYNGRNRRQAAVQRNIKAQRQMLRDAVRQAKASRGATEYHGLLGRKTINCAAHNCTHIECDIGRLEENEFVLVEVFSRIWLNTLIDDNHLDGDISSIALARISALPYAPKYSPPPLLIAVNTEVNPTDPEAGVWELPCGFFKRTRPPPQEKARLRPAERPASGYESDTIDGGHTNGHYADSGARYAPPQM
uniref:Integrin_alpha2 domain-containing protein n=1 Tax=Meloidogyne hapla TaxID=6305 RepID=A0A1I8B8M8_MELHA